MNRKMFLYTCGECSGVFTIVFFSYSVKVKVLSGFVMYLLCFLWGVSKVFLQGKVQKELGRKGK